ncbi:MAG: deoxyguanosinetriphosphate triphosphohydrolase [Gemmataceae bacterium]
MTDDLAPYAFLDSASRGRRHAEPTHPFRTPFQRDRERIVHSSAFRRMTGKTQVLFASVNDHHRTRLTHTLEVTQVARTVARRLRLNEDLTEAIALSHDIGHPPFGHEGENTLDRCLVNDGGFNHNLFGLRRVDLLEERYPDFPGLNLTFEVREAFVRHANRMDAEVGQEFRTLGAPFLEALVVDEVDSIAYDTHDIDDALGLGFLSFDDLENVECWSRAAEVVRKQYPSLPPHAFRTAVVRELLAWQVTDLIDETARRIRDNNVTTLDRVRSATVPLVGNSEYGTRLKTELETFLHARVYRHEKVLAMKSNGDRILRTLFTEYVKHPELLPDRHLRRWVGAEAILGPAKHPPLPGRIPLNSLPLVVCDYLAGMTDRFAMRELNRLFQSMIDL